MLFSFISLLCTSTVCLRFFASVIARAVGGRFPQNRRLKKRPSYSCRVGLTSSHAVSSLPRRLRCYAFGASVLNVTIFCLIVSRHQTRTSYSTASIRQSCLTSPPSVKRAKPRSFSIFAENRSSCKSLRYVRAGAPLSSGVEGSARFRA